MVSPFIVVVVAVSVVVVFAIVVLFELILAHFHACRQLLLAFLNNECHF